MPDPETTLDKNAQPRPPTRRSSWYERFFELLSSRKVDSVDPDFVKVNITPDRSDAGRFIRGLRFLGLIDETGNATKDLNKLRLTGDEFSKNLQEVIHKAYSVVFDKVELKTAKRANLINFFIEKYDLSADVADDAVELFVYFANKAGIQVSDDLKVAPPTPRPTREETPRKPTVLPRTSTQKQTDEPPEGVEELKLGNVRIWLPKGDRSAAETAKRLLDLYLDTHPPS